MQEFTNKATQLFKQNKNILLTIGAVVAVSALKIYFRGKTCRVNRDLTDKVIVITGGTSGIGRATVEVLAQKGCMVIIGARDANKAEQFINKIKSTNLQCQILYFPLDLGDKASVEYFSERVREVCGCINVLINNAGLISLSRRQDKNGFQSTMGANHLGHFYLTYCLWDLVKKADQPRIITVSSAAHQGMNILSPQNIPLRFDDMNFHHNYDWQIAYCRSKVANILFARMLQAKMDRAKIHGFSVSLHPGAIYSDIGRDFGWMNYIVKRLFFPLILICFKTSWEGAQTTLHTVLESPDNLKKGEYYAQCQVAPTSRYCSNLHNAQRLWKVSEQMLGVTFQM